MTTNQPVRFGNYTVLKLLGEGGFARVYLVEDENGEQWALKHIREDLLKKDPHCHEQFVREASIQQKLRHDHIVGVHDFDVEAGYLVLEYVERCETLKAIVEREYPDGMDFPTVFQILEPLEGALTYIHNGDGARPNLAHLDITPKNVLIQRTQNRRGETEWNVRLADFGLARMLDLYGHAEGGSTRWGAGTLGFMAPEQKEPRAGTPGFRSDIYSLGLLIGFMLTGRQTGQEIFEILHETDQTAPHPGLPPRVKQVLQRATSEIPDHRYASVQGLVTAFAKAVRESSQPPVPPLPGEKTQTIPPEARKRWQTTSGEAQKGILALPGYAIAVTLAFLGLLAWVIVQNRPATAQNRPIAYTIQLGGLDLSSYCADLGYDEVTADNLFCTSNLNFTAACRWAYPSQSNAVAKNSDNTNPNTWNCYTPQGVKLGGIKNLANYCQSVLQRGISKAKKLGNGTNQWICEQDINLTIACIWQFVRVDVQARMNDGLWYCYSPSK